MMTPPAGCTDVLSSKDRLACLLEKDKQSALQTQVEPKEGWDEPDKCVAMAGDELQTQVELKEGWGVGLKDKCVAMAGDELQTQVELKEGWGVLTDIPIISFMVSFISFMVSLDTLLFTLEILCKIGMDAASFKNSRIMLLALIHKAQEEQNLSLLESAQLDPSELSDQQFAMSKKFGQYALKMYAASLKSSDTAIFEKMNIDKDDVLVSWFNDDDNGHCPKFILFFDHDSKSLVLSVRGTQSLKDALMDLTCVERRFLDGFAHKGILDGARKILEETKDLIKTALNDNEGYQLVVCGHSLGAGTAELITMELLLGPTSAVIPPLSTVKCVALAPPPVYRPGDSFLSELYSEFVDRIAGDLDIDPEIDERFQIWQHINEKFSSRPLPSKVVNAIEIYINSNDIVPRLSFATLTNLKFMMRAVDDLDLSIKQKFDILFLDKNMEMVKEAVDRVRQVKKIPSLEHPGRIYHLVRSKYDSNKFVVGKTRSDIFTDTICLVNRMFRDHFNTAYETVFLKADHGLDFSSSRLLDMTSSPWLLPDILIVILLAVLTSTFSLVLWNFPAVLIMILLAVLTSTFALVCQYLLFRWVLWNFFF